jgi:hypothetical protein
MNGHEDLSLVVWESRRGIVKGNALMVACIGIPEFYSC